MIAFAKQLTARHGRLGTHGLNAFKQAYRMRGNTQLLALKAKAFGGGSLHAYLVNGNVHGFGQARAHGIDIGTAPRW